MRESSNVQGQSAAQRARLYLGAVGAAVSADVCHRSEERLTVRHALPFLRLDSEVMDEDGRRARISAVRVYVEDDVPTLHMELHYPEKKARRDATLPYGIATSAAREPSLAERRDDTLVFGTDASEPVMLERACTEPSAARGFFASVARLLRFVAARLFARTHREHVPALPSPRRA